MLIGAQVAGNVYNRFLAGATALTLDQWRSFWILPAAFAAVVLIFFGLTFNDREAEARRRAAVPAAAEAPTPAGP
jgi:TRAP-type C4-dicarboxylate transport system permease small subunit